MKTKRLLSLLLVLTLVLGVLPMTALADDEVYIDEGWDSDFAWADIEVEVPSDDPPVISVEAPDNHWVITVALPDPNVTIISSGLTYDPIGGSGTEEDPYTISRPGNLKMLDEWMEKGYTLRGNYFVVTDDLDMSGVYGPGEDDAKWVPIGSRETPFAGIFDGQGHTISGLYTESTGDEHAMFGTVTGTIKNLTVESHVKGGNYLAGIAVYNYGTIENCEWTGEIDTNEELQGKYIGGIAAFSRGAITDCVSRGKIGEHSNYIWGGGGIVGYVETGSVTGCVNDSLIKGIIRLNSNSDANSRVGGIAGQLISGKLENCLNTGVIMGFMDTGGIVGLARVPVVNCRNAGWIEGNCDTGGIVGYTEGDVIGCTNTGIIKGNWRTGGISGWSWGDCTVTDCYNSGEIRGMWGVHTGGIVGDAFRCSISCCGNSGPVYASSKTKVFIVNSSDGIESKTGGIAGSFTTFTRSTITKCYNTGPIVGKNTLEQIGGIVGGNFGGVITDCYNSGTVSGNRRTGGIVGQSLYFRGQAGVRRCLNTGTVGMASSGTSNPKAYRYVGGIIGYDSSSEIQDCLNLGNVECGDYGGGIVGYTFDSDAITKGSITNCLAACQVKSTTTAANLGLFAGSWDRPALSHNYYYYDRDFGDIGIGSSNSATNAGSGLLFNSDVTALTEAEYKNGGANVYVDWDFENVWIMTANGPRLRTIYHEAVDGVVTISTVSELRGFRDRVNSGLSYGGVTVRLLNDIDLSGETDWVPIGWTGMNSDALFSGVFDGGKHSISGLAISVDKSYTGLFGKVDGTVTDLRVTGSVSGSGDYTGGIAGDLVGGTLENCCFIGDVNGQYYVGGLVGQAEGGASIQNCTYSGDVTGLTDPSSTTLSVSGGLAGSLITDATISECAVEGGTVRANARVGGLVGAMMQGKLTDCIHIGDVIGAVQVGGVVGMYYNGYTATGQIISNCCHYGGTVSGSMSVGGVIGLPLNKLTHSSSLPIELQNKSGVEHCYYLSGSVSGGQDVGVGDEGTSSWESIISPGQNDDPKNPEGMAEPLTEEQFKSAASFVNWNFDTVWSMAEEHPVLQNVHGSVTFHSNGGDGSMDVYKIPVFGGDLPANAFTREGWGFMGWSDDPAAVSVDRADGARVEGLADLDLYAVWTEAENVSYVNGKGEPQDDRTSRALKAQFVSLDSGWYFAEGSISYDARLEISGAVNIILKDGAKLSAPMGIHVPEGASLTIWGQDTKYSVPDSGYTTWGTGALDVSNLDGDGAYSRNAAIGGNYGESTGTVTICGGVITAKAFNGAAIGGAEDQNGGRINLIGGCVNAEGGNGSAAIGGGMNGDGGSITISDGYVSAIGGKITQSLNGESPEYAASGIGAGSPRVVGNEVMVRKGPSMSIFDARVHAEAGDAANVKARGIGAGLDSEFSPTWIDPLRGVHVISNEGPLLYSEIPDAIGGEVIDFYPCGLHEGFEDELTRCRYCSTNELGGARFIIYDYNLPFDDYVPASFSYGTLKGEGITVAPVPEVPEGKQFLGWNTDPDGDGTDYVPGDPVWLDETFTLYAQWTEAPAAQVVSASLLLEGDIGVNYIMVPNKQLLADQGAYVTFTVKNETSDPILLRDAERRDELNDYGEITGTRLVFTTYVSAKEMTEQITMRLYNGDREEIVMTDSAGKALQNGAVYSVARYVNYALNSNDPNVSDGTKEFVPKLASYGAYAAAYFHEARGYTPVNPDTEYAAVIQKDAEAVAAVSAGDLDAYAVEMSAPIEGVNATMSLTLEGRTIMNFYFRGDVEDCTVPVYDPIVTDGKLTVRIPNIAAKDLGVPRTVEMIKDGENMTVSASALSYASIVLNSETQGRITPELKDLVRALYLYNQAAIAYLPTN
ncbi:MAG: InlB B-repeat-containing protein [Oscillospiraceae bacterium]|nr:InlB B-repeat-containing protein [Oscillospiraceae bacterium]